MKICYVILLSLIIWGCRGTLMPEKYEPRSLTWTVDTLIHEKSFQTTLSRIWASSGNNAYAVGHSANGISGSIWHYNGSQWYPTNLHINYGGYLEGIFSIKDVYGFSSNDVYVVGSRESPDYYDDIDKCIILHFNGAQWEYAPIEEKEGVLYCVWGTSPANLWASGKSNNIFHYNGNIWTSDSIDLPGFSNTNLYLAGRHMAGREGNDTYLYTYSKREDVSLVYHLFRHEDSQWIMKRQTSYTGGMWMSPTGTLYMNTLDGCYIWDEGLWNGISDDIQMFGIHGTSDNDIFVTARMDGGRVYHYNGSDWYEYKELHSPDAIYWDVWTVDGHVFVVGHLSSGDPQKSIVWHGQ